MNQKKTLTSYFTEVFSGLDYGEEFIFTKVKNKYLGLSRGELVCAIRKLIDELEKMGLKRGDKVAIIAANRTEWVMTDFACMFLGIVTVPIYNSLSPEQIKYILQDSDAKACFLASSYIMDKVLAIKDKLPELKTVVSYDDFDEMNRVEGVIFFSEMMTGQEDKPKKCMEELMKLAEKVNEDDLLTIIYTSGTTGTPKGVMLTHKNIYSNVQSCQKILQIDRNDAFLSFLPYCHVYERTAGYYLAIFTGAKIYYAQNIDTIAVQMPEVKPTIVIMVPRLLDKMYNKVLRRGDDLKPIKKKIFEWGVKVAEENWDRKSSLKWKIANKLVFEKVKERTGGRIRFFVSGGGALNKKIGEFFEGVGVSTLEGYGMTESSPVISVNRPDKNKYGTIGKALDGVMVDFAEDGEILVKGDLVMKGYYKMPEETEKTITNGWLHTGDIGEIDDEGYMKITDRKKSLFKTSGGKYVAPAQVEEVLRGLSYLDQMVVLGNGRMYVTALLVPNYEELRAYAKGKGITGSNEELISNEELLKAIERDIKRVQSGLGTHEKVRKFRFLSQPMSPETGEMTPTLKVKRKVVEERYKDLIEEMYYDI